MFKHLAVSEEMKCLEPFARRFEKLTYPVLDEEVRTNIALWNDIRVPLNELFYNDTTCRHNVGKLAAFFEGEKGLSREFKQYCLLKVSKECTADEEKSLCALLKAKEETLDFNSRLFVELLFCRYLSKSDREAMAALETMTEEVAAKNGTSLADIAATMTLFISDEVIDVMALSEPLKDVHRQRFNETEFMNIKPETRLKAYCLTGLWPDPVAKLYVLQQIASRTTREKLEVESPSYLRAMEKEIQDIRKRTESLATKIKSAIALCPSNHKARMATVEQVLIENKDLLDVGENSFAKEIGVGKFDIASGDLEEKVSQSIDLCLLLLKYGINVSQSLCYLYEITIQDGTGITEPKIIDHRFYEGIQEMLKISGIELSSLDEHDRSDSLAILEQLRVSEGKAELYAIPTGGAKVPLLFREGPLSRVKPGFCMTVVSVVKAMVSRVLIKAIPFPERHVPGDVEKSSLDDFLDSIMINLFLSAYRNQESDHTLSLMRSVFNTMQVFSVQRSKQAVFKTSITNAELFVRPMALAEKQMRVSGDRFSREAHVAALLAQFDGPREQKYIVSSLEFKSYDKHALLQALGIDSDRYSDNRHSKSLRVLAENAFVTQMQAASDKGNRAKRMQSNRAASMLNRKFLVFRETFREHSLPEARDAMLDAYCQRVSVAGREAKSGNITDFNSHYDVSFFEAMELVLSASGIKAGSYNCSGKLEDPFLALASSLLMTMAPNVPPIAGTSKEYIVPVLQVVTAGMMRTKADLSPWFETAIPFIFVGLYREQADEKEIATIVKQVQWVADRYLENNGQPLFKKDVWHYVKDSKVKYQGLIEAEAVKRKAELAKKEAEAKKEQELKAKEEADARRTETKRRRRREKRARQRQRQRQKRGSGCHCRTSSP